MQRTAQPQLLSRFSTKRSSLVILSLLMLALTSISYAFPFTGAVTPTNSIIGGNINDRIGNNGVVVLPSGNILIISSFWNGGRGAVTCLTPAEYQSGNIVVTVANSLTGTAPGHNVGSGGVVVLSNGNYVVHSSYWDGVAANLGAVTWGNGSTCSTNNTTVSAANSLVGSKLNDQVGIDSVTALTNGNYVVVLSSWDSLSANVGAVTWCDGTTGCTGVISAANSLVGSTLNDQVGSYGVTALTNGNYVVISSEWDATGPAVADIGAVTWCNGTTGCIGTVSAANSLIGSTEWDYVGSNGVTALTNGHYVVHSSSWDGVAANVGAVTWGNGLSGTVGVVSTTNSLVGSTDGDQVGIDSVTALTNGNYVVVSPQWDGVATNVGAVTWSSGLGGTVGAVSTVNSLTGSTANDYVGLGGMTALTNGNYVVISPDWNGTATTAGAVTWGNGLGGTVGEVSAANSLVGSNEGNFVGRGGVMELTNGNYLVSSPSWDGAAADVGAVTWGNGLGGTVGAVSAANSLVGSTASDQVGWSVTALTNGNYVVISPDWNGTATTVGAVTWGNGLGGTVGEVSAANSLVGSTANDRVGNVTALTNGNYVVSSSNWDGAAADVGAVTWGNGLGGTVGAVSAANSLVGSTASDEVGRGGVMALTNGNYVVSSSNWDGAAADVGAATLGDGLGGLVGAVSVTNSLVGSTVNDLVGDTGVTALSDGAFIVRSSNWDNSAMANVGAVTYSPGTFTLPGVTISQTAVSAEEGDATGSYTVVLNAQPSADVTVTVTGDAQASVNPMALIFTTVTWNIPQTVTVTAVDDAVDENAHTGTITHSVSATGGYTGVTAADVTVNITDDDTAGVTISETAVSATEGGVTGSYTVVLTSEPTADVTITLTGDAQASVSPTELIFTSADWETAQTVTVTAVDDTVIESAHTGTITHSVSATGGYTGVTVADVTVNITDDEIASVSNELLTNGGFETAGVTAGIPLGWKIIKPSGDKRACPLVTTNIHSGACAFKFTGSSTDASKLTQVIDLTGVTFAAGDTLTASAFFKGNNATAKIRVTLWVYYTGNSTPVKTSLTVLRNAAYTQHSLAVYTLTSGAVDQIKLQFNHFSNAGTIWLDDASLVHTVPAVISRDGAVLDMPSAPEGFRK